MQRRERALRTRIEQQRSGQLRAEIEADVGRLRIPEGLALDAGVRCKARLDLLRRQEDLVRFEQGPFDVAAAFGMTVLQRTPSP